MQVENFLTNGMMRLKLKFSEEFKERVVHIKKRKSWLFLYELVTIPALVYGFYCCIRNR